MPCARNSILVVSLVSVLALGLGLLLSREITQPIRTLRDAALQLAKGDFKTRVSLTTKNEVGVLGDTFNIMGERIERAVEEIREAADTNRELFIGTVRMLANAIDAKDPYTRGHSERVAFYSTLVAKELGMNDVEIANVHLSGLIHDVGKIGIEDRILRKPAALTDDEYEIMKQHPTKGAQILEAVPKLKALAGPRPPAPRELRRQRLSRRPQGRRDSPPRPHGERGRRLRRHDHRPALLEGHDLRGRGGAPAVSVRQEVRFTMRRRHGPRRGLGENSRPPRPAVAAVARAPARRRRSRAAPEGMQRGGHHVETRCRADRLLFAAVPPPWPSPGPKRRSASSQGIRLLREGFPTAP